MAENEQGFSLDPDSAPDAMPDEHFVGVIRECVVRDAKFDRLRRPIRQLNVRVERMEQVGVLEDGNEIPLSRYANASLERQVKDQSAPGGVKFTRYAKRSKAHMILGNWVEKGLPLRDFSVPPSEDGQGNFIPLPEEAWESPKTGEEVKENRVHIEAVEGIKCRFLLKRVVPMGKNNEAHDVLLVEEVLPPDFEVAPDQIQRVSIKRETTGEAAPGESAAGGAPAPQPAAVDPEAGHAVAINALVGLTRTTAFQALMAPDMEPFRVEPWVTGLSGDLALVDQYIQEGKLVEDDKGAFALPS